MDDLPAPNEPVFRLQVRGTPELEINWEIVQPDDTADLLSAALRRKIGVVRLGGDERNDRDLRLVYGSALDRLLADKGLRARIGQQVSEINLQSQLGEEAAESLEKLDDTLKKESLPHKLELGLTSSQGLSIGALVGLFAASSESVLLPLASWGAGTRRMATLQIAAATESETRITLIDEIERGLEPYRIRKLTKALQAEQAQVFATTHSAVAISAADAAHLWYMDAAGNIGELPQAKVAGQQRRDPETFLAKLAVICEGPTEVGFLAALLERGVGGQYRDHGIHVADGQGNTSTLALLEAMAKAGLVFAGFVDNEGTAPERWSKLKAQLQGLLFQWPSGNVEENVVAQIDEAKLIDLLKDQDGDLDGDRLRTLADRLGSKEKDIDTILAEANVQQTDLRTLIIAAGTGSKEGAPEGREKEWQKHARHWFKSEAGGRELASRMFALGVWPSLQHQLLPFLNAIRQVIGQAVIQDLPDG
jgi:putative ATP-dependent endonuclease of OLD family